MGILFSSAFRLVCVYLIAIVPLSLFYVLLISVVYYKKQKRYISRTIHSAYYVHPRLSLFTASFAIHIPVECINCPCRLLDSDAKMFQKISSEVSVLLLLLLVAMATAMPQCEPAMPFQPTAHQRMAARKVSYILFESQSLITSVIARYFYSSDFDVRSVLFPQRTDIFLV